MLTIDGSYGEGGGQVLRTALALSVLTEQPIRIENIRAKRNKPGLQRQHLMAARAAAQISGAKLSGDAIGSRQLQFAPGPTRPGTYRFDIGSAGSTTLVLQTILPPLLLANDHSTIEIVGGTHNPFAPPLDFLERAFLPLVNRMGPKVSLSMKRPGFYPAGGGLLKVEIEPADKLAPLELVDRGQVRRRLCRATVSNLPDHIAARELAFVAAALEWSDECLELQRYQQRNYGPGNVLVIEIESEHLTEVFTGFGRRGVPAEAVAESVAAEAARYLEAKVPVGEHLADQLLLPLALAGCGAYVTLPPTQHTLTNIEIIGKFLDVRISVESLTDQHWRVVAG